MKSLRIAALAAAVASVTLVACGDDTPDSSGQATSTAASTTTAAAATSSTSTTAAPTTTAAVSIADALRGTTFVSTAVEGYTLVPDTKVTLTFDGENLSAQGGCNTLGGTWSLDGDVLVVPPMVRTMMACEPSALMDQETWLDAVLTSKPTVAVDGDTLTITADGATVTLLDREVADPDRPLEGTTWTAESLISAEAVSSIPAGVRPPTLRLDDGQVSVDTGCNTGRGSYTLAGDAITFGPLATTRMACVDPNGQQVETAVLAVLTGTATSAIDGPVLTLTNGANGLQLRAAPDAGTTTTAAAATTTTAG
jgi:heat shock protein HslJ